MSHSSQVDPATNSGVGRQGPRQTAGKSAILGCGIPGPRLGQGQCEAGAGSLEASADMANLR